MASLIPGFEYDIFISYRQKDNKGERWVSEFVEALQTELESTFKEEISVYFDINPHDGLLETHDVDASLKRKLKCLVFIPIISRTYCDPKSFAWEHEFVAFVEQASNDQYGLKISLPNGNVMSRVLPVRIHDLDTSDMKLCESVLGGMMRGVDFVYKSTGVNRPLRSVEDHPHDNIHKTYYRDQINKVANSLRDIIHGMLYSGKAVENAESVSDKKEKVRVLSSGRKFLSKNIKRGILLLLFFMICAAGFYMYSRVRHNNITEKTIAIIPMTFPLDDSELNSQAISSMEQIIYKLQKIKSLSVRGYLTSYYYLNTKEPSDELRKDLKCNYLVVIKISRNGDENKMLISLTDARNDKELWSQPYSWNEKQLSALFTKIVQIIAGKLDIEFTSQEILNMEKDLTTDPEAYGYYLTGSAELITAMGNKYPDTTGFKSSISSYDKAIEKDPDFAIAYARRAIALTWGIRNKELDTSNIKKCLSDIDKASGISNDFPDVHIARGFYYYYIKEDFSNALMSFNIASEKDPESYLPPFYMAMVNKAMGNWDAVKSLLKKVIPADPQDPLVLTNIGLCFEYLHIFDSAMIYHQKAIKVNRDWTSAYLNKFGTLLLTGNLSEARLLLDSLSKNSAEDHTDDQVTVDLYEKKYVQALTRVTNARAVDFGYIGVRNLYLAKICALMNDKVSADRYFDLALAELNLELEADSNNANIHALRGLAMAGKGDTGAISEGKKAVSIAVKDNNKILERELKLLLAEIYTKLGMSDEAFELIEDSLRNPSLFSTEILKKDPMWIPLENKQKFNAFIKKYEVR